MADELKYKVSIETEAVEASDLISPSAIQALVELNREIDQYRKELSDVQKQIKATEGDTTELEVTQERLKGRIKETSTEYGRQQRELLKMETATKAVGTSYNDLVKQNAALSAAMRALPIGENTAELQKLQAQYNANNERLKEFDKAMGNHQRNVGNYSSALDNLGGMLSSIPGPIGDIVRTFEQFSNVLKAAGVSTTVTTTKIQGFTVAESAATVATAAGTSATIADTSATVANAGATTANTTAQTAQATAAQASATAIGFDTSATVANTVATTANTGATAANATAQGAQAASATTAAAATGTMTVAQRVLNTVMKANPVMLVVGAFAALVAMLTTLQPVMNNIERITTAIGTAFNYARDTVYMFINGIDDTRKSFLETIRVVDQYTKRQQELNAAEADYIRGQADMRRYIAGRRLDAKNESLSIARRTSDLESAIAKENEMMRDQLAFFKEQADIAKGILDSSMSSDPQKNEAAQKYAQAQDAITGSLTRQRELEAELTTLRNKGIAEANALAQNTNGHLKAEQEAARERERIAKEQQAAEDAAFRKWADRQQEIIGLRAEIDQLTQTNVDAMLSELDLGTTSRDDAVLANAFQLGEELAQQTVDQAIGLGNTLAALEARQAEELRQRKLYYLGLLYSDEEAAAMAANDLRVKHTTERAKTEEDIDKQSAQAKTDIAMIVANSVMGIGTAMFGKTKALSVAQAIIDTYAAANSAMKTTPGGPFVKGLAVAAVIAKGMANVKAIMSTKIGSMGAAGSGAGTSSAITESSVVNARASDVIRQNNAQINAGTGVASMLSPNMGMQPTFLVEAKVDRDGMALAVRDGERSLKSQQISYM